ncbi:nitroreductase family protein [Spirillospora sp. CA-128828]|uniref:nitroreductase family protein n=1 Tax=Spirillospora sp. CA-128828 TaxID=3240033 RepID=UPI003D92CB64
MASIDGVVREAVEDAAWAPSVHNTQPWRFSVRGSRISLRADAAAGRGRPGRPRNADRLRRRAVQPAALIAGVRI